MIYKNGQTKFELKRGKKTISHIFHSDYIFCWTYSTVILRSSSFALRIGCVMHQPFSSPCMHQMTPTSFYFISGDWGETGIEYRRAIIFEWGRVERVYFGVGGWKWKVLWPICNYDQLWVRQHVVLFHETICSSILWTISWGYSFWIIIIFLRNSSATAFLWSFDVVVQ